MKAPRRGRPPKDPADRHEERLQIRAQTDEKEEFELAAKAVGMTLSDWIRQRLKACAKRDIRRAKS